MVGSDELTAQVVWLGLTIGSHLELFYIYRKTSNKHPDIYSNTVLKPRASITCTSRSGADLVEN